MFFHSASTIDILTCEYRHVYFVVLLHKHLKSYLYRKKKHKPLGRLHIVDERKILPFPVKGHEWIPPGTSKVNFFSALKTILNQLVCRFSCFPQNWIQIFIILSDFKRGHLRCLTYRRITDYFTAFLTVHTAACWLLFLTSNFLCCR